MEAILHILRTSGSESEAAKLLKQFCDDHIKTFSFQAQDVSLRKDFIDVILEELGTGNRGEAFETNALSALRILGRDKNGLGLMTSENACRTLFTKAGLYIQDEKQPGYDEGETKATEKDQAVLTCTIGNQDAIGVGIMDYESCLKTSAVITESLKCLCNIVYHSREARDHCIRYNITKALLFRLQCWFGKELPVDIFCFDLRLLFLLTAYEDSERNTAFESKGLCILTHALDACVPGKEDRDRTHSSSGNDGCGEVEFEKLSKMTVVERFKVEKFPQIYEMTADKARLAAEILKVIFNVTMAMPKELSHDILEHYERIALIDSSLFTHVKELPAGVENIHSHALNTLNSMPKEAMHFLYWGIPKSVSKAFVADFEINRKKLKFRSFYLTQNMASIQFLLCHLNKKLDSEDPHSLIPEISALCCLAKGNRIIRKYLRLEVLPPLTLVTNARPEEGSTIKSKLVKLMTSPIGNIQDMTAELLFVLCKENADRLIKHTGYGNAAGLLARRGLMAGGRINDGEYSSDDAASDTEEYKQIRDQIDPIIGTVNHSSVGAIPSEKPNPLDSMTEEEKEEEAMKLVEMIKKLNRMGIIQTTQIGPDGRPQEQLPSSNSGQE